MPDADPPAGIARGGLITARQDTALSAVQQVIVDFVTGEQLGHAVERKPLAHAVQVDRYTGAIKRDRLLVVIEFDILHADPLTRVVDLRFRRNASLASRETPCFR